MLFTDSGSGRAAELAAEVGRRGGRVERELAERADLVVLAVKPAKLDEVAAELGAAKTVVSLLGGDLAGAGSAAFPGADVIRVMPNVAVEVRRGVLCVAGATDRPRYGRCSGARPRGRAARLGVRRRHGGDGLRPRLSGARGRGDRRRRGRRRGSTRSWLGSWWSRRPPGPRSCCASATRRTCAGRSPRRAAAPRPGSRRSTGRAPARRSRPRSGLAGEDAAVTRWRSTRERRRRLRQRALPRLHHPDLRQHPDLLGAADSLQPRAAGRARLRHRDDQPLPQPLPALHAADRRRRLRARPQPDHRRSSCCFVLQARRRRPDRRVSAARRPAPGAWPARSAASSSSSTRAPRRWSRRTSSRASTSTCSARSG